MQAEIATLRLRMATTKCRLCSGGVVEAVGEWVVAQCLQRSSLKHISWIEMLKRQTKGI